MKYLVSATAVFCLILFSACHAPLSDFGENKDPEPESAVEQQDRLLTSEEIMKMTPEQIKEYYAIQQKRKKGRDNRSLLETLNPDSVRSRKKRDTMGIMDRQLRDDERGSVFPWKSGPSNRSKTLKDQESAIYHW